MERGIDDVQHAIAAANAVANFFQMAFWEIARHACDIVHAAHFLHRRGRDGKSLPADSEQNDLLGARLMRFFGRGESSSAHPYRSGAGKSDDALFDCGVDVIESKDLIDSLKFYGFGGHAEDDRGSFVLRNDVTTGLFDGLRALRTIGTHSSENNADGKSTAICRNGFHGDIDIWKIAANAAADRIELHTAERIYAKVLCAGTDVKTAGLDGVAGFGFLDANFGKLSKLRRELRGERCWHVLHENYRSGKFFCEAGGQAHYGGGPAG